MTKYPPKPIKSLGRVVTGKTPPKNDLQYFEGDELFVSPRDLDWDQLYVTQTATRVSSKALEKFRNQVIPRNTVMFTSLSFAFGKVGIASRASLTNQQINSVVVNGENYFRFVYYLLRACTPFIFAYNSGIDTPIVPKSVFERIRLSCPSLGLQRKLAAVLWAYDELIENNKRRIALLEKMAAEIYREWFIRFRFPGREQVKFVKGIPEGWDIKKLGSVLELCYGKALKEDDRVPGEYHVYGSSGVVGTHDQALVKAPGLIVGRKGNVGSIYLSDRGFFPIDTVYYVKSDLPNSFLYFLLRSMNFINNDAAVPGLNRGQAYSNQCFIPPAPLVREFARVAEPQFELKRILSRQNEKLVGTRDLLLGRLITGKLSIENLDIQFPPAMADELNAEPTATAHA
jgi:type I restriction enzyme S subunit